MTERVIPGPCISCGGTDYPLSMGGPSICPACDCGIPPGQVKAERELAKTRNELIAARARIAELEGFLERVRGQRDSAELKLREKLTPQEPKP